MPCAVTEHEHKFHALAHEATTVWHVVPSPNLYLLTKMYTCRRSQQSARTHLVCAAKFTRQTIGAESSSHTYSAELLEYGSKSRGMLVRQFEFEQGSSR